MMSIEILNLSDYDPDQDIVVMYVDVGKMPPPRVKKYIESVKKEIKPMFIERGFETLFIPIRDGQPAAIPDVVSKVREQLRDEVDSYDTAMKHIGVDK